MPKTRKEKYFASLLIGRQNHSKLSQKQMPSINIIIIYYWNKKLKNRLHVLEADIITIEKIYLMSLSEKMYFYRTCSK